MEEGIDLADKVESVGMFDIVAMLDMVGAVDNEGKDDKEEGVEPDARDESGLNDG